MMDRMLVDETDLTLVNALQLAPRASWAEIGAVIGIDAGRAARRWRRLHTSGLAWATVVPGDEHVRAHLSGAAVEVHCATHAIDRIAQEIAQNPWVLSIEKVTHRCELLLEVIGLGLDHVGRIALHEVGAVAGVEHVRVDVATELFVEGGTWRLDALSPGQQQRLRRLHPPRTAAGTPRGDVTLQIASVLRDDIRATAVDIAQRLDWSESSARRRLDQVLGSQALRLRVDLAQPATGFPLTVTSWFRVPARTLAQAGANVAALRSTRVCAGLTGGAANLLIGSWLRGPQDVPVLDVDLAAALGDATLIDRTVTVRTFKRAARLLAEDGTAQGLVSVDL